MTTWRSMGLSNYLITGVITLLIIRATPFRGIISRVISPIISSYLVPWASR